MTPVSAFPIPKVPVFDWNYLRPCRAEPVANLSQLPAFAHTTSGRAALFAALRQLDLPPGAGVLVPTYHCPTMVAPVLEAGLRPVFYPLGADGQPLLDAIEGAAGAAPGAMIVAHYFGLPRSWSTLARWCRDRGIVLIEDCAHCYFGMAGERPVGHWGDFATASISKFLPVPECGLLGSAHRPLRPLGLRPPGARSQAKAAWDVIDTSVRYGRLAGLSHLLSPLARLRGSAAPGPAGALSALEDRTPTDEEIIEGCDMGRVRDRPTFVARLIHRALPFGRLIAKRREHYRRYDEAFASAHGARPLVSDPPPGAVPYVYPLWIEGSERADAIYAAARQERLPIFRWDRRWPGTPVLPHDNGLHWSRHVLQLLCHQDLRREDIDQVTSRLQSLLKACPSRGPKVNSIAP
ncbi:DegT/DnrJ/EryC1/StrS family aminotransferase [Rubrivivax sp. A210]|uniref:DegT/DnrJ/EryC1/StrS family aminotransferase n=1 Tax=Rubrivivax sp. A210 TaxID=2772301 RepID=UPI001917EB8D|nr:DegT/DnrJ/EryC1/StrS family aminotransferase [Rubrivivax sp. A210]